MDPHRCGPGLLLAAACVLFRAGLTLWTDSVLSCDGRHSTDHLGFERGVFDVETCVSSRQELTNATLGTVDILQDCDGRGSSNHVDPDQSTKKYLKNSSDTTSPHCGGAVIVGYSKSGQPLFANTTLCHQGTMEAIKRPRKKTLKVRSKPSRAPLPSDDVFTSRKSGRARVPPTQGSSWNHSLANLTADSDHCGGAVIVGYSKSGQPLFANTTLCHQGTMEAIKRRRKKTLKVRSKPSRAPLPSDDVFTSRKSGRARVPPIPSAAWNHSLTQLAGDQGSSSNHSLANLTAGP